MQMEKMAPDFCFSFHDFHHPRSAIFLIRWHSTHPDDVKIRQLRVRARKRRAFFIKSLDLNHHFYTVLFLHFLKFIGRRSSFAIQYIGACISCVCINDREGWPGDLLLNRTITFSESKM